MLTYGDLRRYIANEAGYNLSLSFSTNQETRVDDWLAETLRLAYDPAVLPNELEKHQWNFLCPEVQLKTTADQYTIAMPPRFSDLLGPLVYMPDEDGGLPPFTQIKITSDIEVMRCLRASSQVTGYPTMGGLRVAKQDQSFGTDWEMVVYPTPNDEYTLSARMKLNPTLPGRDDEALLGGQQHEQLFIAACRAVVERFNRGPGDQWRLYIEALRSSISHDRRNACPHTLGYNGDRSDMAGYMVGMYGIHSADQIVTYNGAEVD